MIHINNWQKRSVRERCFYEKNVSAEQYQSKANSRIFGADGYTGRAQSLEPAAGQGKKKIDRYGAAQEGAHLNADNAT